MEKFNVAPCRAGQGAGIGKGSKPHNKELTFLFSHKGRGRASGTKFPPFGKQLAMRVLRGDKPFLVRILIYGPPNYPHQTMPDAWAEAKQINRRSDSAALVLPAGEPPGLFTWPVRGLIVVIEHWPSKGMDRVVVNVKNCLLRNGAEFVAIRDTHFNCLRWVF